MSGGGTTPVPAMPGAPLPASGYLASVVDASRLELPPGRVVVLEAQVIGRTADGTVRLLTRHGPLEIRTAAPLQPGTTAMIEVTRGAGDQLTLRVIPVLSARNLLPLLDAFKAPAPGSTPVQSPSPPRAGNPQGAPPSAPANGGGLDRSDGVATGGARATAVVLPQPRADTADAAKPANQDPSPATSRAPTGAAGARILVAAPDAAATGGSTAAPASQPAGDGRSAPSPSPRPLAASSQGANAMRIDPPPSPAPQQRTTPGQGSDRVVVAGTMAPARPDAAAAVQAGQAPAAGAAPQAPTQNSPQPGAQPRPGSAVATGTALAPQPGTGAGNPSGSTMGTMGTMLAPGSTVELRIDMAAIQARRLAAPAQPGQPQSSATPGATPGASPGTSTHSGQPAPGAGGTATAQAPAARVLPLPATVAGALPQGRLVLDTPLGRLAVAVPPDLAHALPGEKLELSYVPETIRQAARPTGAEALGGDQARRWNELRNLASALAASPDPALRAAADRLIPAPGPRLAQQMMAFVAQADGPLAQWLGAEAARGLEKLGLAELVQRGATQAQPQAEQGAREADGAWRSFTMPFLHEGAIRPIQVRARRRREQRGGKAREQSRFVVDCTHDDLGEIQIDGLMTTAAEERRLDVILRSHGEIGAEDRVAMLGLFRDACGAMGLGGDLAFQVLERFPPIAGAEAGRRDVLA